MGGASFLETVWYLAALFMVITIHEFSHAITAYYFGDPTAKLAGRITLNPLAHIDIMGLFMMFMIHIGWGKPVPVNPHYFKNPKRDEALTALAGPLSNLVLAFILAVPLKYIPGFVHTGIGNFFNIVLDVSIYLFVFNMIPFPPLDGSKFIGLIIPHRYEFKYQQFLQKGTMYFALFLLFDYFVLSNSFGFSVIGYFMGKLFVLIKSIVFLGT